MLLTKFWRHPSNVGDVKLCLYDLGVVPPRVKISGLSSKGS